MAAFDRRGTKQICVIDGRTASRDRLTLPSRVLAGRYLVWEHSLISEGGTHAALPALAARYAILCATQQGGTL